MPRTYREMYWAACGKEYAEWERTDALWTLLAEAHRNKDEKATPYKPGDLFRRPGRRSAPRGNLLTGEAFRAMKSLFVKKRE